MRKIEDQHYKTKRSCPVCGHTLYFDHYLQYGIPCIRYTCPRCRYYMEKSVQKMKCPFLESEDCETCGYYDYVPEKKCYDCLHPFLNADDEKQQDWKKIVSYMRECGYEWSYEHMKHDYQTYYLHDLFCAFSLMDIIANRTVQCMRLFEENVPLEEITRFSEPQAAHMD